VKPFRFVSETLLVTLNGVGPEARGAGWTERSFLTLCDSSRAMQTPKIAIVLPEVGAAPVVLSAWFADPGDAVFEGDRLVEVLVGGATFDVSSPATGRLAQKQARRNERLVPGQVLGFVEAEAERE